MKLDNFVVTAPVCAVLIVAPASPAPETWSPGRPDPASATWELQPYRPLPPAVSGLKKNGIVRDGGGTGSMRDLLILCGTELES